MTWTLRTLVVAACLIAATTAQDYDYGLEDPETKLLVDPAIKDGLGVFLGQLVTYWLAILAVFYIITAVFAPAFSGRSLSWNLWDLMPAARSGDDVRFLEQLLNSIDPVESTFAMLQVEEVACRRRTVCEVQRAASRMPLLGSVLQYFSPSVTGLEEYKEAQDAGAALEDCALLFSECPTSLVQTLWGEEQ
nr:uncharacterized protein LOC123768861 isoform X2 [Procambarus clarkii]